MLMQTFFPQSYIYHSENSSLCRAVYIVFGKYNLCYHLYLVCLFINEFIHAFTDNPSLLSHVPITIQVLDVNDNPPEIIIEDEILICESIRAGQVSLKKVISIFFVHTTKGLIQSLYAYIKQREYSKGDGKERGRERLKAH